MAEACRGSTPAKHSKRHPPPPVKKANTAGPQTVAPLLAFFFCDGFSILFLFFQARSNPSQNVHFGSNASVRVAEASRGASYAQWKRSGEVCSRRLDHRQVFFVLLWCSENQHGACLGSLMLTIARLRLRPRNGVVVTRAMRRRRGLHLPSAGMKRLATRVAPVFGAQRLSALFPLSFPKFPTRCPPPFCFCAHNRSRRLNGVV